MSVCQGKEILEMSVKVQPIADNALDSVSLSRSRLRYY
jgi:hypothetical protein